MSRKTRQKRKKTKKNTGQVACLKIGDKKKGPLSPTATTINPAITKFNVTAFPAAIHPVDQKPMKLPRGAPVNVVFTLDSTYDSDVLHLQDLFPYPTFKLADYFLTTADGALNVEGIPFSEFPFNLGRCGKRSLWLVRK